LCGVAVYLPLYSQCLAIRWNYEQVQELSHARYGGPEGIERHRLALLDAQMAARTKVRGCEDRAALQGAPGG
jgi:hypothetical protein